jgi:hypothetical protein
MDTRAPIDAMERVVRFVALAGPLFLWIAVLSGAYWAALQAGRGQALCTASARFAAYALCAAPWLILFKWIAFDHSSTDNLNELIQGNGPMLYPLLVLLPATALALVHATRRPATGALAAAALALTLSLPLGWLSLSHGLADEVHKYGLVYSGVDFLLGPDRQALLPEPVLMARWAAVQLLLVAALAAGMRAALPGANPGRTLRSPGSVPGDSDTVAIPSPGGLPTWRLRKKTWH